MERLTARLKEQTEHLRFLQEQDRKAIEILEARVHAIYVDEPPDMLSILVSARTFDDLIDSYELVNRLGLQDQRIAREVKEARSKAAAKRRATEHTQRLAAATVSVISARTDEARGVRDELVSSRDTLSAARRLKRSALADARETRTEYLHEVEALAAQSAELAAAIQEAQSNVGSTGTGIPSAAGFIWPVNGTVVSGYGMAGAGSTRASTSPPRRARRSGAAAGTVIHAAGWEGTATSSSSTTGTVSRPHTPTRRPSSSPSASRSARARRSRSSGRPATPPALICTSRYG